MSKQSTKPAEDVKRISPVKSVIAALGIGGVAQYAFHREHLIIGLIGYGIAIWFFTSRLGWSYENDVQEQGQGLDLKLFQAELREITNTMVFIRKNWRQMTIAEILSSSFKMSGDQESKS